MENLMLPQANNANAAIELKILDTKGKEKNAEYNIKPNFNK